MKLIWHIIRKDIVRERWLLSLWVGLIVGRVSVGFAALYTGGDWLLLEQIHDGLQLVQVVLGYGIILRMVHADGLIGPKIAWATRPISGGRLLLAKVAGALLIFGLLPLLLQLPWWLACHFELSVLVRTAGEVLGWQLVLIAAGFLVGSLTEEAGQVLLATLLQVLLAGFFWMATLSVYAAPDPVKVAAQINVAQVFWTRLALALQGFSLVAMLIVGYRYMTRRWLRSLALAGCAYGGLILWGAYGPVDDSMLLKDAEWGARLTAEEEAALTAVTLAIDGPASLASGQGTSADQAQRLLFYPMRAVGLPKSLFVKNGSIAQQWTWSDGVTHRGRGAVSAAGYRPSLTAALTVLRQELSLPLLGEDPETARWFEEWKQQSAARRDKENAERILSGIRSFNVSRLLSGKSREGIYANGLFTMPLSLVEKARRMPPSYQAKVSCELARTEIVVAWPLRSTTRGAARSYTVTARVTGDGDGASRARLMVHITTTRPQVDEHRWYANSVARWLTASNPAYRRDIVYYFVNRVTGSIDPNLGRSGGKGGQMRICGVILNQELLRPSPYTVMRNGQWVDHDPQWEEHTSLVLMRDRAVTRIEREIRMERFEIEAAKEK